MYIYIYNFGVCVFLSYIIISKRGNTNKNKKPLDVYAFVIVIKNYYIPVVITLDIYFMTLDYNSLWGIK